MSQYGRQKPRYYKANPQFRTTGRITYGLADTFAMNARKMGVLESDPNLGRGWARSWHRAENDATMAYKAA